MFSLCGRPFLRLAVRNLLGYSLAMIISFAHKGLEDFFYDGSKKGIQPRHARKLTDILDRLNAAHQVEDMRYPGLTSIPSKVNGLDSGR